MLKINLSRNRREPVDESAPAVNSASGPDQETVFPAPEAKPVPDTLFLTAPEPEAQSEDSAAPVREAEGPEQNRQWKDPREKVPLSTRETEIPEEIRAAMQNAGPTPGTREESPSVGKGRIRVMALAAALVLIAGYFAWSQRDFIAGFIPVKPTVKTAARDTVNPTPKPAPGATSALPAKAAAPDSITVPAHAAPLAAKAPNAAAGNDPVLAALTGISTATPPRVWLTSASARSDGGYDLKGMSFSHEAMQAYAAALERRGTITAREIPAEAKAPDTVYTFHLSGKLNDLRVPEILDALPANRLYALGDSLRAMRKDVDIVVVRLPKTGKAYAESELPFELEGPYSGLQRTLDGFLLNRGVVIDRISIHPAASGKQFNRVRASFSLRRVSSI